MRRSVETYRKVWETGQGKAKGKQKLTGVMDRKRLYLRCR